MIHERRSSWLPGHIWHVLQSRTVRNSDGERLAVWFHAPAGADRTLLAFLLVSSRRALVAFESDWREHCARLH